MITAGTAATASGQPRGRATAHASTTSRVAADTASAAAAFRAGPPWRMATGVQTHPTRSGRPGGDPAGQWAVRGTAGDAVLPPRIDEPITVAASCSRPGGVAGGRDHSVAGRGGVRR